MSLSLYHIRILVLFSLLAGLGACAKGTPPQVSKINVEPGTTIPVNGVATLTIQASGSNLQFKWTPARGTVSDPTKPSVLYTAPDSPGPDTVTVEVTSEGTTTVQSMTFQVIAATTPSPVQPVTEVAKNITVTSPAPTTPLTVSPTSTTAPLPTTPLPPTSTPTPTAATGWTWNITDGASAAQSITLTGLYPSGSNEHIWVLVQPHSNGLYYPQSMRHCEGLPAAQKNGKWEMQIGLGGPTNVGERFNVVVMTADAPSSQSLSNTLAQWCKQNNYPGLKKEELPPGLTTVLFAILTRSADRWGPAPALQKAPSSQVTLTNVAHEAQVPKELVLEGNYTNSTGKIWVLTYSPNGLWYPQSTAACNGVHAQMEPNGQWHVRATFGNDGDVGLPYDIAIVLADANANAILARNQQEWCQQNSYPGMLTLDLPDGVVEQTRIRVYRAPSK